MTEYIEREALKILFAGACAECRDSCAEFDGIEADCNQCLLNGVIKDAKSIPAADVRPVVLCRDCDCWNVWDRVRDTCSCGFWSEDRLIYTKEKDFCSWGRKRGVDE